MSQNSNNRLNFILFELEHDYRIIIMYEESSLKEHNPFIGFERVKVLTSLGALYL